MSPKQLVTSALLALSVGCAGALANEATDTPEALYAQAMDDLESGLYPEALEGFANVKAKFPYSKFAALADLRTADTQFERAKFIEAIDAYRAFLKYHPTHAEAPYAMFRIAESYYEQMPSTFWALPPPEEKDQGSTRLAIGAYKDMLARYPDAEQAEKAKEKLAECRRRLADHELYVANFYMERERWLAAAGRAEGLLREFAGLGLDADALWIAGSCRAKLNDPKAAREALERLTREFPAWENIGSAAALLRELDGAPATSQSAPPKG